MRAAADDNSTTDDDASDALSYWAPDNQPTILIVDDSPSTVAVMLLALDGCGYRLLSASSSDQALELARSDSPHLILLDAMMPEVDGFETCRRLKADPQTKSAVVVFISGLSEGADRVKGLEAGAVDFVSKPIDIGEVRARVATQLGLIGMAGLVKQQKATLEHELSVARAMIEESHRQHPGLLVGASAAVQELRLAVIEQGKRDEHLLLYGPGGCEPESIARAIHRASDRVHCAFLSWSSLLERPDDGRDHLADAIDVAGGGTFYAEHVAHMPQQAQARLAAMAGRNNVRIIAFTPADLSDPTCVPAGLDPELGHVLTVRLGVPSLARRTEDIGGLAEHFARRAAIRLGRTAELAQATLEALARRRWPGDMRELRSVIEHAVSLVADDSHIVIDEAMLGAQRLGQYQLVRKLSEGGMGEIWEARHDMLARAAAVKVIRLDRRSDDAQAREQFAAEARMTAKLRSPHTVELYDFGVTTEGELYYVMELLEGLDLSELIAEYGPQSPERVIALMSQACFSIAEAHKAGLIHRDIKPSNLYLCALGMQVDVLKVLDFGVAKRASAPHKGYEDLVGTPVYMTPEALACTPSDQTGDLYALGCTMFELLAGESLYERADLVELRDQKRQPVDLSRLPVGTPAELVAIVGCCLAPTPAERFGSAMELRAALARVPLDQLWTEAHGRRWWNQRESGQGHLADELVPGVYRIPGSSAHLQRTNVGPYELGAQIGRGGMAYIHLARDPRNDQDVVLKILDPAFAGAEDSTHQMRFLEEARVLSALDHRGVVRLLDFGADDDLQYLVMERLVGESLDSRMASGVPLASVEAARIGGETARALAAVHAGGLIHRDIKPSNIMLLDDGQPILIDFGLALDQAKDARLTKMHQMLGTPSWMSPEQLTGTSVDPATDVYSLGATLYYMLAGQSPTDADVRILEDRQSPEALSTLRPGLPPELIELIESMMSIDPRARPAAAAAATVLERLALSSPGDAEALPVIQLKSSRPALPRALAVVLLLLLLALGAWSNC